MELFRCCDCDFNKNDEEFLWSFTQYGNNPLKKEDFLAGNQRCLEHFLIKEKELDEAYSD